MVGAKAVTSRSVRIQAAPWFMTFSNLVLTSSVEDAAHQRSAPGMPAAAGHGAEPFPSDATEAGKGSGRETVWERVASQFT
jgi:hypothetical protein